MLFFRACPRCKGTLDLGSDAYGSFKHCLHCGYWTDCTDDVAVLKPRKTAERPLTLAKAA